MKMFLVVLAVAGFMVGVAIAQNTSTITTTDGKNFYVQKCSNVKIDPNAINSMISVLNSQVSKLATEQQEIINAQKSYQDNAQKIN